KAAQDQIRHRESVTGVEIARIKLNGAAQLRNRLVPMPKPPLDKGDRENNINVIRKTLFRLLKFREPSGEIALPEIAVIAKCKVSLRQVRVECERAIEG